MSNRLGKIILCLILCLSLGISGCALPVSSAGEARALAQARQNYRQASLVVSGTCTQVHINANGENCYDFTVEEILAGDSQAGSVIHCLSAMEVGKEYLLYLEDGEDAAHTEDMQGYALVSGEPLALSQGAVTLNGQSISLETLILDMARLDATISAPSALYYYDSLEELAQGADDIFIGQVEEIAPSRDTQFHSQSNGTTVEQVLPASIVTITAFGSTKGALKYGDTVKMVHAPAMNADLINAATLLAEPYSSDQAPELKEGAIYLFFTVNGPDAKQNYIFPVNPMEGFVRIQGDLLLVSYGNRAMADINSLDAAIQAIRACLESIPS